MKSTQKQHDTKIFTSKLSKLSADLRKIGVKFHYIKWNKWSSTPFEYEYYTEDNDMRDYILYSESRLMQDARSKAGIMKLSHDVSQELISNTNKILKKYFPSRTLGIQTSHDPIKIFFEEKKSLAPEKEKTTVSVDLYFTDENLHEDATKYLNKLKKLVPKKMGYLSEYDQMIVKGKVNAYFNVCVDDLPKFKKILRSKIPNIKSIKVDY